MFVCAAVHGQLGAAAGRGHGEGAVCGQPLCWGDGELGGEGLSGQHSGKAAAGLHLHSIDLTDNAGGSRADV